MTVRSEGGGSSRFNNNYDRGEREAEAESVIVGLLLFIVCWKKAFEKLLLKFVVEVENEEVESRKYLKRSLKGQ